MAEKSKREIRAFEFEVRAEEDEERGTYITGRPIVYDARTNLGWYDETIAAGALDKADLKDVRLLVNHNTDMIPLARSRNNNKNSTMQLSVDAEGLTIRADLDVEGNSDARGLYSAVKRGDISGMSFMFTVDGDKWDDLESEHPKRTVTAISKVFEVSAVTFPAYAQTSISARGMGDALEGARSSLESAKAEKRALDLAKSKAKWRLENEF